MATRYNASTPPRSLPCPSDVGADPANEPEVDPLDAVIEEVDDLDTEDVAAIILDLREMLRNEKFMRIQNPAPFNRWDDLMRLTADVAMLQSENERMKFEHRMALGAANREIEKLRALYAPHDPCNDDNFPNTPHEATESKAAEALEMRARRIAMAT